jgi:hypothetical protein
MSVETSMVQMPPSRSVRLDTLVLLISFHSICPTSRIRLNWFVHQGRPKTVCTPVLETAGMNVIIMSTGVTYLVSSSFIKCRMNVSWSNGNNFTRHPLGPRRMP